MTNREMLERMSDRLLGDQFCETVAKDGDYCKQCPFAKWCNNGECGFEVWLGLECKE